MSPIRMSTCYFQTTSSFSPKFCFTTSLTAHVLLAESNKEEKWLRSKLISRIPSLALGWKQSAIRTHPRISLIREQEAPRGLPIEQR